MEFVPSRRVAQGSGGKPPPSGGGDRPCRQPQGSGCETPEDARHTPCASPWEQAYVEGSCSGANGGTSLAALVPVRTRGA
jgi:hypothetical protein